MGCGSTAAAPGSHTTTSRRRHTHRSGPWKRLIAADSIRQRVLNVRLQIDAVTHSRLTSTNLLMLTTSVFPMSLLDSVFDSAVYAVGWGVAGAVLECNADRSLRYIPNAPRLTALPDTSSGQYSHQANSQGRVHNPTGWFVFCTRLRTPGVCGAATQKRHLLVLGVSLQAEGVPPGCWRGGPVGRCSYEQHHYESKGCCDPCLILQFQLC